MNGNYKKLKNLFLQQSYLDSWEDYLRSLRKESFVVWDYIILTASNEEQAEAYRLQIEHRIQQKLLPTRTKYMVLSDPDGKRVGSGGATLNVLKYIAEQSDSIELNHFQNKRILVLHSGGDSKRVPQYSACGKLFSPVPRELPNGKPSTLFDEFIIAMTSVASRVAEGMLVIPGDELLLFNPLQIDFQYRGAAAISIKEPVELGKNHGVFLNDGSDNVELFLHKQSIEHLYKIGAVNEQGNVDFDTGAVIMDANLLHALFSLISTNNQLDKEKFYEFVNEEARISFYGDFLYPLAYKSTLEDYYKEAPEGNMCEALLSCRKKIWDVLHEFSLKLICLSPAEYIHFGTTEELSKLVTSCVDDYEFLGWKQLVMTNVSKVQGFAMNNSLLEDGGMIGDGSYIEDSWIAEDVTIGENCIISNLALSDISIPSGMVLHGLRLKDNSYVTRVYGVLDNPKGTLAEEASYLGGNLATFMSKNHLNTADLWNDKEECLWFANLYPICDTMKETLAYIDILYKMSEGIATTKEIDHWKATKRTSLYSSFNEADVKSIIPWKRQIENRVVVEKFIGQLMNKVYYKDVLQVFGATGMNDEQFELLMTAAEEGSFALRIRIYYVVSRYMKQTDKKFSGLNYDDLKDKCFEVIQQVIYDSVKDNISSLENCEIVKEETKVSLPVRLNWGGGWTDAAPQCNEKGGAVLNAAIKLNGEYPIQVTLRRIEDLHIEFESTDVGVDGTAYTVAEIQACNNPYDYFALHKAALIACGVIPLNGEANLEEILRKLGGGIRLSTNVIGVPKGSGLGTSSILAGACVKGIYDLLGYEIEDSSLYDIVFCMEQIMSTGGGWQDQVGGIAPGIKLISSMPGIKQKIKVEPVVLKPSAMKELEDRFALIYTGQRRLARNLYRDVVASYLESRKDALEILAENQRISAMMKFELERGHIDEFAALLNKHWEIVKQLEPGSTNTCIDQISVACKDLIDGEFIAGAGGGGFLQVILKKGVTRDILKKRLQAVYQDSGVAVWDIEFV